MGCASIHWRLALVPVAMGIGAHKIKLAMYLLIGETNKDVCLSDTLLVLRRGSQTQVSARHGWAFVETQMSTARKVLKLGKEFGMWCEGASIGRGDAEPRKSPEDLVRSQA